MSWTETGHSRSIFEEAYSWRFSLSSLWSPRVSVLFFFSFIKILRPLIFISCWRRASFMRSRFIAADYSGSQIMSSMCLGTMCSKYLRFSAIRDGRTGRLWTKGFFKDGILSFLVVLFGCLRILGIGSLIKLLYSQSHIQDIYFKAYVK